MLADGWAIGYPDDQNKTTSLLCEAIQHATEFFDPAMLGEEWAVPDDLLTPEVLELARSKFGEAEVTRWLATRR